MTDPDTNTKLRIMIPLMSGGMLWQARSIVERLGPGYEYLFVTAPEDMPAVQHHMPNRELHVVPLPSSSGLMTVGQKVTAVPRSFWHAARQIQRLRPHVILCVGTCLAIPLFLMGRLAGAKTIFVESLTRVTELSRTGWMVARLRLADRMYVQWPALAKGHPGVRYQGNVL